jgi:hypothetical protein
LLHSVKLLALYTVGRCNAKRDRENVVVEVSALCAVLLQTTNNTLQL